VFAGNLKEIITSLLEAFMSENLLQALHQSPIPSPPISPAIFLRLITPFETIERPLVERATLKLGRQVKSAQEKMMQKIDAAPVLENSRSGLDDTLRAPLNPNPTNFPQTSSATTGGTNPNQQSEKPQSAPTVKDNAVPAVWFKSKVVSRSHAEIWLKDGQVRTTAMH
jgi:hypothetical protein